MTDKKMVSNEDIKRLMLERLNILSSNTSISIGSEGSLTRDEMIENVKSESDLGELFTEIQMNWLRSFQNYQ